MDAVKAILSNADQPVIRLAEIPQDAAARLRQAGWTVLWLDETGPVGSHDVLLNACALAGDFPDYFGGNLNALKDCLAELPEVKQGYVLLLRNARALEEGDRESFDALIDICETVDEIFREKTSMRLKLALGTTA